MSHLSNENDRLEFAWKCIMKKFDFCLEKTKDREPGINIFKFKPLPDRNGMNCDYIFVEIDSVSMGTQLKYIHDHEKIRDKYIPDIHIIISVNIPTNEGHQTILGDMKIFDRDGTRILIV